MSPGLPLITTAERRHRLGRRHRLAPSARATSAAQAADAVVALHTTDAATVFLSARARLAEDGQGLDAAWLAPAEADALAALDAQGASTGSQISAAVPALRQKITISRGKKYETETSVATRVIRLLAADGRIRRDRPRGSWTSSQFRWVHTEPWPALPAAEARAEIARRWLHAYGPATEADLRWWTGWTLTDVRKALAAAGARQVRLDDGSTAIVSPGDAAPEPAPEPWAALLPGLDPSGMGWADPGRAAEEAGTAEAVRLAQWLGEARVTPRFRTPLERELVA
ncbi:DNA glycosylase AlkZ-like family protein [Streptomyces goshikiensis]|uniref:DNA glycosylase AlkZ-like family protein n=1 Tax=Streptomyces goshikiensis TaxID=1942 RepID=UPI003687B2B1